MTYSESQADREIDKISDPHAFNRYTIKAAMDDDDMAYLFECFFKHETDLDTGKPVTKHYLEKQLIQFNREISRRSSEAQFIAENRLVKQDTRLGQVYQTRCDRRRSETATRGLSEFRISSLNFHHNLTTEN